MGVRLFIAIELTPELVDKAGSALKALSTHRSVKWVRKDALHLTLRFLGDTDEARVPDIKKALERAASKYTRTDIRLVGSGAFPNRKRPRVIWIGVHAEPELYAIQREIEMEAQGLDYDPEDKTFSPHLTLGRVRQEARPHEIEALMASLEKYRYAEFGSMLVSGIALMKSDLRPGGAVYTKLGEFPLSV